VNAIGIREGAPAAQPPPAAPEAPAVAGAHLSFGCMRPAEQVTGDT
jgi:hypothetical protein